MLGAVPIECLNSENENSFDNGFVIRYFNFFIFENARYAQEQIDDLTRRLDVFQNRFDSLQTRLVKGEERLSTE